MARCGGDGSVVSPHTAPHTTRRRRRAIIVAQPVASAFSSPGTHILLKWPVHGIGPMLHVNGNCAAAYALTERKQGPRSRELAFFMFCRNQNPSICSCFANRSTSLPIMKPDNAPVL